MGVRRQRRGRDEGQARRALRIDARRLLRWRAAKRSFQTTISDPALENAHCELKDETCFDGIAAVLLRFGPLERDAELIFGPPRHPASPVSMPISETQFEAIWHVARVRDLDAGPTIGEIDNGAGDRRAGCKDFGVLQEPGAPDGSTLVHGFGLSVGSALVEVRHACDRFNFDQSHRSPSVTSGQIDATGKR